MCNRATCNCGSNIVIVIVIGIVIGIGWAQSGTYLQVWQLAKSSLQAERQEQHSLAKKLQQVYLYLYLYLVRVRVGISSERAAPGKVVSTLCTLSILSLNYAENCRLCFLRHSLWTDRAVWKGFLIFSTINWFGS